MGALSVNGAESSDSDAEPPEAPSSKPPLARPIGVRRIGVDDGELLRTVRLAAIADSPGVYATTLREAKARPLLQWERVAEAGSSGGDQGIWFGEIDDEMAGMVSAYRTSDDIVTMTSLWSAPGFRHVGVAEHLVGAVVAWAVGIGGTALRLWVVQRNEHARAFCSHMGFEATGAEMPYEPDPRMVECELRKPLTR